VKLTINIDGGSRGNPGPAGAGVIVRDAAGTVLAAQGVFLKHATNNVAEYTGLLTALQTARRLGGSDVAIFSDSELLVRQMNGQYRVKNEGLKPLFDQAGALASHLPRVTYTHVRREFNKDADRLANLAMNAKRDVEE